MERRIQFEKMQGEVLLEVQVLCHDIVLVVSDFRSAFAVMLKADQDLDVPW